MPVTAICKQRALNRQLMIYQSLLNNSASGQDGCCQLNEIFAGGIGSASGKGELKGRGQCQQLGIWKYPGDGHSPPLNSALPLSHPHATTLADRIINNKLKTPAKCKQFRTYESCLSIYAFLYKVYFLFIKPTMLVVYRYAF